MGMIELTVMTDDRADEVRVWRNELRGVLRTPFLLTAEMQEDFYNNVICNRHSNNRFYAAMKDGEFIGMAGLINIEWENGLAEISIILNPDQRGKGNGQAVIEELLRTGFNELRLENIYGECYCCNPCLNFWLRTIKKYDEYQVILPCRKYLDNKYYDSIYFNFNKNKFNYVYGSKDLVKNETIDKGTIKEE